MMPDKLRYLLSSSKVRRGVAIIVTVITISALLWYLSINRDEINQVRGLSLYDFMLLSALIILGHVVVALKLRTTATVFGLKHPLWESFLLVETGSLVNLVPINAGSGLRAMYLKNVRGLKYVQFSLGFLSVFLTSLSAAGMLGMISLASIGVDSPLLFAVFAAYLLCPAGIIVLALTIGRRRQPAAKDGKEDSFLRKLAHSAMQGLSLLSQRPRVFVYWLVLDLLANLILGARFWIVATGLGHRAGFAEALVMQSVGRASTFATVVPSGTLGIREALTGLGAAGLGLSAVDGVLIATVDRIVAIAWIAFFGLVGLYILRKQLEKSLPNKDNEENHSEKSSKESLA